MSITKSNSIALKIAIGAIGVAFVFGLLFAAAVPAQAALTQSQVDAIISLLQSFGADAATIDNVRVSLSGGTPSTPSGGSTASVCPYTWSTSLTSGSTGADVKALQQFLNSDSATQVAASGIGSAGQESNYFGSLTKGAVVKFQDKYASEVLAPVGLSAGTGYFGSSSRAKANSLCSVASTPGTPTVPTGTGLSIVAGVQPANSLAVEGAARVPYTTFTVTAGSDGDVVLNSVIVERSGLLNKAVFAGVVLLKGDGTQLGNAKTLNSNYQATIGEKVTIPAGSSMTFTVAGNMLTSGLVSYAGEVGGLSVIAVNTSAVVSGVLPITGASHVINSTLSIGSAAMNVSSFDPNSEQSKEIGTTDARVAGVRVTAGSGEDIRMQSMRWNQVGSAGGTDIANVVTVVGGVEYATTISADGNYYNVNLGSGIVVTKGSSIDMYVTVDIIDGTNRTVIFDINKATDIYITGELYGYGITPTQSQNVAGVSTSSTFTGGTPFFDNATLTISAGSVTTIQKATSVAAQNVAVNVSDQPLGGFETDIKGEAITISGLTITVATSSAFTSGGYLTNVTIVDQNGAVVAGPIDSTSNNSALVFTDSITIPTGKMIYTVKGKVGTNATNGGTYVLTTVPTSTWTSPVGEVTGDTVTISNGSFPMNTMTVRAAALVASLATSPSSQNIVAGGSSILFANLQLDASQSGEDVRMSSVQIRQNGTITNLNTCQLFDGTTPLNTGGNVPSTLADTGDPTTFTFDSTLTIPKGTVKTLGVKCNLASNTSGNHYWTIDSSDTWSSTGVTSGSAIGETFGNLTGGTMTIDSGSVTLAVDSSSPSYTLAAAGTSGVTVGVLKLRATNEALTLQELGLTLDQGSYGITSSGRGGTVGSGTADLLQVYIYDGATQVGTVTFTGDNQNATSTLLSVTLPKDTDKILIIKADLASIGTSDSAGIGNLIKIDPQGAKTTGQASGTTIWAPGATAAVAGVQLFKSLPTLALDTLSPTGGADGRLMRFKVTADSAGSIGLQEFTFTVASTTGVTVTQVNLKAYTDSSYSQPISGQDAGGQINSSNTTTIVSNAVFTIEPTSNPVAIPAGATIYFELKAAVSGMDSGDTLVTTLSGDTAVLTGLTPGYNVSTTTGDLLGAVAATFIWTGNSTSSATTNSVDWTNGYSVPGLPSGGLIQTRSN